MSQLIARSRSPFEKWFLNTVNQAKEGTTKMKRQPYRIATSRWFARLLSLLAFAAIGGSFALNALAFDTDDPAESAWGPLDFFNGSIVRCQLTDANSQFVGSVPDVIIAQVGSITCTHLASDGITVLGSGEVTLEPPGIKATQVTAGSCKTNQQAGTSERNYASQCGNGADVTFKFTWNSGATGGLAGQTYQGGGAATLTNSQCNIQFPAAPPQFAKGQLVSAKLSFAEKACQGPEFHSAPFNFRTCTDNVINNSNPATCIDVTHVGTASLIQFKTVTADTRDSVNSPGCPANGVLKVALNGADLSAAGFSPATVDQNSFSVGPPDNPFLFPVPANDVVFGEANPFQGDLIPDVKVSFPRCIGPGGLISVIDASGFVTVTGRTIGIVTEAFAGSAQARITSGH